MNKIQGGVTAAKGFQAASAAAGIKYKGRTDMALVYTETPAVCAGTFTTNVVKAAPVYWDKDIVTKKNPVFSPKKPKEISRILSEIYETQCEGSMFAKYKVQSLLYDFFAELVISENTKRIYDPISRAIRTIEYNYNNKITVQGLAESFYLDEAYFSRLFKEVP